MIEQMKNRFAKMSTFGRAMIAGAIITGTLGAGTMAMAKGPGPGSERWEQMSEQERQEAMSTRLDRKMARMTEKLELTDAQVPQVRAILEKSQASRLAIMEKANGDRKAARPEMKELKQSTHAELASVLTPAQLDTLDQLKKERRGKRGKHGKKERFERMAADLELTEDQQVKIKAIMKESRQEREEIIGLVGSKKEAKPELKELRVRTDAQIKAVLTAEQAVKFDERKAERKARHKERRGNKRG